jgi:hypothetical protein
MARLAIFKLHGPNNNKRKQFLIRKLSTLPGFKLVTSKTASQRSTNSAMLTPLFYFFAILEEAKTWRQFLKLVQLVVLY